jgi:hypothetical protein
MRWSLSRLRPLHIALLSTAYWVGLIVVKLGAPIVAAWQVNHLGRQITGPSLPGWRICCCA